MNQDELKAIKDQVAKNKHVWSVVVVGRLVAEIERLQAKVTELEMKIEQIEWSIAEEESDAR